MDVSAIVIPAAGGAGIGFCIGFAIKKVIKLAMIVLGVFFGALVYLQSQGILNIDWGRVEAMTQGAMTTILGSDGLGSTQMIIANLGIPLTGGMVAGFFLGFSRA